MCSIKNLILFSFLTTIAVYGMDDRGSVDGDYDTPADVRSLWEQGKSLVPWANRGQLGVPKPAPELPSVDNFLEQGIDLLVKYQTKEDTVQHLEGIIKKTIGRYCLYTRVSRDVLLQKYHELKEANGVIESSQDSEA